jgi:hypothetical protein
MTDRYPVITAESITPRRRDGYKVFALCTVYGYPAEVAFDVDTHDREYSYATVNVFDAAGMRWVEVYRTSEPAVRELPIIPDSNLDILNAVARRIHQTAVWATSTAHIRQDEINAQAEAAEELARLQVRRDFFASEQGGEDFPNLGIPVVAHTGDGQEIPVHIITTEEDPK